MYILMTLAAIVIVLLAIAIVHDAEFELVLIENKYTLLLHYDRKCLSGEIERVTVKIF